MKTTLIIAPHLSTGGMPAYLVYQVGRLLKHEWRVVVVECDNIAPIYNVQKKQLQEMLGKDLYSWEQNTEKAVVWGEIERLIREEKPDVVHMAEFPELFFGPLDLIYNKERNYKIVETSHSFDFDFRHKVTRPDGFVFVSEYQGLWYANLGVPYWVDKYPVEIFGSSVGMPQLGELLLDKKKKHVLHVGLFCERKQQGYVIEIAKLLQNYPVQFHFVGNMADNFKDYWKPLLDKLPRNCTVYGERHDVDMFYKSLDLLVFPSKAELNPLVPREAIAHGMPILMTDLPIYRHEFDDYNGVGYLSNRLLDDALKVLRSLGYSEGGSIEVPRKIKLVHMLSNPSDEREIASIESLQRVSEYGVEYVQHVNGYNDVEPDSPPTSTLDGSHARRFGAFCAFKRATLEAFADDVDLLVLCESDCVLNVSPQAFADKLVELCSVSEEHGVDMYSLGPMYWYLNGQVWSKVVSRIPNSDVVLVDSFIQAHCVAFAQRSRNYVVRAFDTMPWDVIYYWLPRVMGSKYGKHIGMLPHAIADQVDVVDGKIRVKGQKVLGESVGVEVAYERCRVNKGQELDKGKSETRFGLKCVPSFIEGPRVEVVGNGTDRFDISFIDAESSEVVHRDTLGVGGWTQAYRRWYTEWILEMRSVATGEAQRYKMDLKGKRVLVQLGSKSLGDTVAWFPYVEEFRKKYECEVICTTFWNKLFKGEYKDLVFVEPGSVVNNVYAGYEVGCFDNNGNRNKVNWRVIPMQQIASDILGLEYKEIRPRIDMSIVGHWDEGDYVCLSEHSTLQCKYWNYPGGWQQVVDYLNARGVGSVVISKEPTELQRVAKRVGRSIEETMATLAGAKAFLGVGSGLAWLAWAMGVPVVMVSGFSLPMCEMQTGVVRITNEVGCTGCFNDPECSFDRGNWLWCPRSKGFECSKNIKPEVVIQGVERALARECG